MTSKNRAGFSLVEILTALTILAFAMTGIGRIMMTLSQRNSIMDLRSKRTYAMTQQESRFLTMSLDTLAVFPTTAKTFWAGDLQYTRRLSITNTGNNRWTVKITIVPTGLHGANYNYSDTLAKDSVSFDRSKPMRDALCTGC